jgi:hypothetical protein
VDAGVNFNIIDCSIGRGGAFTPGWFTHREALR